MKIVVACCVLLACRSTEAPTIDAAVPAAAAVPTTAREPGPFVDAAAVADAGSMVDAAAVPVPEAACETKGTVLAVRTVVDTGAGGVASTRKDHKEDYVAVHPALEFIDAPKYRERNARGPAKHYLPACNKYTGALPCLDFDACGWSSAEDRAAFAESRPPLLTCKGGDVPARVVHFRWEARGADLEVLHSRETDPKGTWLPLLSLHPKGGCVACHVARPIGNAE